VYITCVAVKIMLGVLGYVPPATIVSKETLVFVVCQKTSM
jgi:hypothetical protein